MWANVGKLFLNHLIWRYPEWLPWNSGLKGGLLGPALHSARSVHSKEVWEPFIPRTAGVQGQHKHARTENGSRLVFCLLRALSMSTAPVSTRCWERGWDTFTQEKARCWHLVFPSMISRTQKPLEVGGIKGKGEWNSKEECSLPLGPFPRVLGV